MSTKPYDGQPHTFDGVRGAAKPHDLSIRDLRDCLLRSLVLASFLPTDSLLKEEARKGIYENINDEFLAAICGRDLSFNSLVTNFCCEIEKAMGTYPNVDLKPDPAVRKGVVDDGIIWHQV